MTSSFARKAGLALGTVVLVLLALGVGYVTPTQPVLALGVALVVLALGLSAWEPAAIPLMAMPLLAVILRANLGGAGLSYSDLALGIATGAALVFAPRPFSPVMRNLLWLNALYQFATLFTVLLNPFTANTVEWVHAWVLISGSLLVGWTIGRRGLAHVGLTLLLLTCLVLAASTIYQGTLQWWGGNRDAVYTAWPYPMHKNMVGTVMAFAALIVFVRPPFFKWPRWLSYTALAALVLALLFTQSRQAVVALGIAVVFVAYRQGLRGRNLVPLLVIPALVLVAALVQDQFESDNKFNSAFQRLEWFEKSFEIWQTSPWVGVGLRAWYRSDGVIGFQPPQAELEVLVTSGVLGLAAFVVFMVGSVMQLLKVDKAFGTLAVAEVGSRFIQGQFDLFWVAAQASVPFAIAGVCLGAAALADSEDPWHLKQRLVRAEQASEEPQLAGAA